MLGKREFDEVDEQDGADRRRDIDVEDDDEEEEEDDSEKYLNDEDDPWLRLTCNPFLQPQGLFHQRILQVFSSPQLQDRLCVADVPHHFYTETGKPAVYIMEVQHRGGADFPWSHDPVYQNTPIPRNLISRAVSASGWPILQFYFESVPALEWACDTLRSCLLTTYGRVIHAPDVVADKMVTTGVNRFEWRAADDLLRYSKALPFIRTRRTRQRRG